MTLEPLLNAPPATRVHALIALAAFVLGTVQLARAKGDMAHRVVGYTWVAMMAVIAASSFLIHDLNQWMGFSGIHVLSVMTLVLLPLAVLAARHHRVATHARRMQLLFLGALVIAGLFTLAPGRIMHKVVFGLESKGRVFGE